jgi:hypothetical protein
VPGASVPIAKVLMQGFSFLVSSSSALRSHLIRWTGRNLKRLPSATDSRRHLCRLVGTFSQSSIQTPNALYTQPTQRPARSRRV